MFQSVNILADYRPSGLVECHGIDTHQLAVCRAVAPVARRTARTGRIRRGAFTFVEMLVVVLILGIVAAVAAPTFHRSLQYHRLESAARRVKQDLEYLQTTARRRARA